MSKEKRKASYWAKEPNKNLVVTVMSNGDVQFNINGESLVLESFRVENLIKLLKDQ